MLTSKMNRRLAITSRRFLWCSGSLCSIAVFKLRDVERQSLFWLTAHRLIDNQNRDEYAAPAARPEDEVSAADA